MSEYKGDVHRDLLIPLGRAMIGGLLVGIGLLTLAFLLNWSRPWVWFLAGWSLSSVLEWFRHSQRTITTLERWLNIDINQDGQIGPAVIVEPPQTTRIEVIGDNGRWADFLDLPIDPDLVLEVARMLTSGADFSGASLAGPHKVLSRAEWESLRDRLIIAGYARWVNPRAHSQGAELTNKGIATIRGYASITDLTGLRD